MLQECNRQHSREMAVCKEVGAGGSFIGSRWRGYMQTRFAYKVMLPGLHERSSEVFGNRMSYQWDLVPFPHFYLLILLGLHKTEIPFLPVYVPLCFSPTEQLEWMPKASIFVLGTKTEGHLTCFQPSLRAEDEVRPNVQGHHVWWVFCAFKTHRSWLREQKAGTGSSLCSFN